MLPRSEPRPQESGGTVLPLTSRDRKGAGHAAPRNEPRPQGSGTAIPSSFVCWTQRRRAASRSLAVAARPSHCATAIPSSFVRRTQRRGAASRSLVVAARPSHCATAVPKRAALGAARFQYLFGRPRRGTKFYASGHKSTNGFGPGSRGCDRSVTLAPSRNARRCPHKFGWRGIAGGGKNCKTNEFSAREVACPFRGTQLRCHRSRGSV